MATNLKKLILGAWALTCTASLFAQGTVVFNNRIAGAVITHIYGINPAYPPGEQAGNGSNDFPPGTTDWSGWTALSGSGYTAELWAAPGANQPESALRPAVPTTTFRTGNAAGFVVGTTATLDGVPADAPVATVRLRVWDNQGGTVTSWAQAVGYSYAGFGESQLVNLYNIGGIFNTPPNLAGMQSFNLYSCIGTYFWGVVLQPISQVVVEGETAAFGAEAIACPHASYQWFHDGVFVGAYETYQITNALPSDAGHYWVVAYGINVDGSPGSSTSRVVTLTVLAQPIITFQPQSQTAEIGSRAMFGVHADGFPLPAYQWFFDGTTAFTPPTTESALLLTDVQPAESGAYTVVVTNMAGAVTSAPARLSVILPVPRTVVPALTLTGQPGSSLNLEFTDTLSPSPSWLLIESVDLTSPSQWFFDLSEPMPPQGFYRAWQVGSPSVRPALNLNMVPAITLTGMIGSSVRLDYINQIGPTDAWLPLATVILTNSSQLYFDTSMIGQPPRIYRLVPLP